jgi:hypothetical protein
MAMSGHIREFSEAAKAGLLEQIVLPGEPGSDAWDFLKDLPSIVCPPKAEPTDYAKDIDPYHRDIINFKFMSRSRLERIWANTHAVDERYHAGLLVLTEQAQQLVDVFLRHIDLVNPVPADGGEPLLLRSGPAFDQGLAAAHAAGVTWKDAATTRAVERMNDERMQAQIEEMLAQDKYVNLAWEQLSAEERAGVLTGLMKEVNVIMGTNIDTKMYLPYHETATNGDRGFMHYDPTTNQLGINITALAKTTNGNYSLRAIVHEVRHCYQHEAVDGIGGHIVSAQTREVWKFNQNGDNYISLAEDGSADNLAYRAQPTEYDANMFAGLSGNTDDALPVYLGSWGEDDATRLVAYLAAPSEQGTISILLNQGS